MEKNKSNIGWGILIVVLILSAYILPYTVLSEVQAWYGSFLLWGIVGILIIIANFKITKGWGK
ncbi:MAG TPA: hypothetical protein VK097_02915 [Lentibacillus sp.]|uniref:hypothetical protein n=1 Tax=Lentibacillus sp. TaxID=1925746 RepID=UPI002B4B120F|nr:hypothetical protein [Lentibacillus sp.]HLR61371.1 hypothetical protein [Lentibacillus sp.]